MYARLAFSICAHVDADILIIDETLAVGDEAFQSKCLKFIQDFSTRGTVLFVSHSLADVEKLCNRTIWLENGAIREIGESKAVAEHYHHAMATENDNINRFHVGN